MTGQRILGQIHVFANKSISTTGRRSIASSSKSLRWNRKNGLVLFLSAISVAGLSYQAGEIHQKQIQNAGNSRNSEALLKPQHFKNSIELRSRSSLMGYKMPPYPLNEKRVQELLEAGERVIKDELYKTHINSVVSKCPTEDEWSYSQIELDRSAANTLRKVSIWGIYDGHGGWEMSRELQASLPHAVFRALEIFHSSKNSAQETKPADESIKEAFTTTDNNILDAAARAVESQSVPTDTISKLGMAYAGSCALLSIYDSKTELFRVACTGDSRAVLGRKNSDGTWSATALSTDQTGFNLDEVARLEAEHPNERGIIQNGRIATLAVTRAFGDCALKWSQAFQSQLRASYFGRTVPDRFSTMPYLTAEPVITTTKIRPGSGDFVVMASDGLWDNMTSDQAVELVGRWLEAQDSERNPDSLKMSRAAGKELCKAGGGIGWGWKLSRHDYVVQDSNAATHLIRNSLGGANSARVAGLLTPVAPMASEVRDDITVQVIFF